MYHELNCAHDTAPQECHAAYLAEAAIVTCLADHTVEM